jgi:glycosyltransferase involved in cell wall biosynthesis
VTRSESRPSPAAAEAADASASVVIPTRDRPAALGRCLAALARQEPGPPDVIVVDDASRDRAAVDAVLTASALEPLVVRTPGRGPAAARNLGARAATGEVVLFLDDDCEPEPGWARLLGAALSESVPVAAGRTVSPPGANAAVRASQAITNRLLLASLGPGGRLAFAPTCNLACRRDVVSRLPFDEGFPDAAGEDRDWWARVVEAAIGAAYEPDALVVHCQGLDGRGFARQQFRYGRGAARYRRGGARDRRLSRPGLYVQMARDGLRAGPTVGALVLAAQGLTAAGIAAERLSPRR